MRELLRDPVVNLAVATFIGVISGILLEELYKRRKRLWWASRVISLQTKVFSEFNKEGKIQVFYKGREGYHEVTDSLLLCRFIFWNGGNEVLLEKDISAHAPLFISFEEESKVLDIREVALSNESIQFEMVKPNKIRVLFEYLNPEEGAVVDIVYRGDIHSPMLEGVVKGGQVHVKQVSRPTISLSATPRLYLLMGWLKPRYQVLALRWFSTIIFIFLLWATFISWDTFTSIFVSSGDAQWDLWRGLVGCEFLSSLVVYAVFNLWIWRVAVAPRDLQPFYNLPEC